MDLEKVKQEEQEIAVSTGLGGNHGLRVELQTEADLSEHHDHDLEEEEAQKIDYTAFTKQQLASLIKELSKDDNFKKVEAIIKEIKPLFDEIREKERAEAMARFLADGGTQDDFDYKGDEFDTLFDANYKLIRDRKNAFHRQQEESKQENLLKKLELLEKMRQLIDSPEGPNQFDSFKDIQKQWKTIGAVPLAQTKT
ncbi:MAG: DUF349 domain-containing protein, partial [Flammeovirgaceae bacterium]|nr:DUF349 domain-containing protein [Flammeovirgaceae bacterium]